MIDNALYHTISQVCPAFPLNGDVSESLPIAVYGERHNPIWSKDQIEGYEGSGIVSVISRKLAECRTLSDEVVSKLSSMEGNEVKGVKFRMSRPGEVNIDYDPEDQAYYSEIQFSFKSQNI